MPKVTSKFWLPWCKRRLDQKNVPRFVGHQEKSLPWKLELMKLFFGVWSFTTVDGWNPANQLRLVVYPIIFRVFYIPGGCLGFQPSTVVMRFMPCCSYESLNLEILLLDVFRAERPSDGVCFFLSSTPKGIQYHSKKSIMFHFFMKTWDFIAQTLMIHVWYIYLHLVDFHFKLEYSIHGSYEKAFCPCFFQSGGPSQHRFPWSMIKAKMVEPWILVVKGGFQGKRSEETAEGFPCVGVFLRKRIIHESRMGCRCLFLHCLFHDFFFEQSNSDMGNF